MTPIGRPLRLIGATRVVDRSFEVFGPPGPFDWVVFARRAPLDVEPRVDSTVVRGEGPYRYMQ